MPKSRARFIALQALLARHNLDADEQSIKAGQVIVDGRVITNPAAWVRADVSIRVQADARLRGDIKLSYALDQSTSGSPGGSSPTSGRALAGSPPLFSIAVPFVYTPSTLAWVN
jgi:hypothetical protein